MKQLCALAFSLLLSGCSMTGPSSEVAPPKVDEFPQHEVQFRVLDDVDAALRSVQEYLAMRGLASIATVRAPKIFVITTYVDEPSRETDRRVRRTAFRIALSPLPNQSGQNCTALAVSTLTKSRGIKEEIWSVQESDMTFESSAWPDLRKQIASKACK